MKGDEGPEMGPRDDTEASGDAAVLEVSRPEGSWPPGPAEGLPADVRSRRWEQFLKFWRTFRERPSAVAGLGIVFAALVIAALAPILAPYDPFSLSGPPLAAPSADHFFGTDVIGRDILSLVIYGFRVALLFGLGVAGITLVLGIVLGAIPAYFGGVIDDVFSRFFEVVLTIPRLVLTIILVVFLGNSLTQVMIVVALTFWPSNAKIIRAQVLSIKSRGFVRAAVASGAGHTRVLVRHVVPNGIYPVIANTAMQMGFAILFEASLSFLGLGDPNVPSWGQLLAEANLRRSAWWMSVFPGIAITIMVVGFNLIGDGMNHALDPRLRNRR